MSIKFKEISTNEELYRKYWKLILINLLDGTSCILVSNELNLTHNNNHTSFFTLANNLGLTKFIKDICKENSKYSDQTKEFQEDFLLSFIQGVGTYICDKMALHGYLVKVAFEGELPEGLVFDGFSYVLGKEGIEISLKLQEHADNDRRHNVTVSLSRSAFGISLIVLLLAVYSAYLNYKRLDLYEEELQKVQSTQTAILSNIKDNKK